MSTPPVELPSWVSPRPIPADEQTQPRRIKALRLSDAEIHALRRDMAKASTWMRTELRRRRLARGVPPTRR